VKYINAKLKVLATSTNKFEITDFPGESYSDIVKTFLEAASHSGYTHFRLLGMLNNYNDFDKSTGSVEGLISETPSLIDSADFSNVRSLKICLYEGEPIPDDDEHRDEASKQRFGIISFFKMDDGSIKLSIDLDHRLDENSPTYLEKNADIIDRVADSYR